MHYTYRSRKGRLVYVYLAYSEYPESDEMYDLCICPFTNLYFQRKDGIVLGSVVPQVTISSLCNPIATDTIKKAVRVFQDFEKNCNTCKHFSRVKSESKFGFLTGICKSPTSDIANHSFTRDKPMDIHPKDHMNMNCYEPRI
jgi:hypothetical protein